MQRDYSLVGPEGERAEKNGLASADWYASAIPRKRLKELMQRKDGPAIRDTLLWLGALALSGWLGWYFWGTWWAVPAFAVYGVLYGSACDSRWHECGHGTAFKTQWMNDVVYHLASFMVLRESTSWRWSHARHHTDTIIVGRDPEIAVPRPPDIAGILLNLLYLKGGFAELRKTFIHAAGRLTPDEATYIPADERPRVYLTARIYLAIHLAFIAWAVAIKSILPLMYVGLPSFYGAWLMIVFGTTQHAGLAEDVLDHRLNCRTVYMNPVFRFLYWNMNYHLEHHMFPMVPYHALPALHEELKADLPVPYPGLWAAYREIIPTLIKQTKDPRYFVKRELPASAQPFPSGSPVAAAGPQP
jgi:fatty acid desaturase